MPFHILKIPSLYEKRYVISNGFERFWTVFERHLNALEREHFFYAIGFEG